MVLNFPLDECIDNTHTKVTREKRNEQKETPTSDRKTRKAKSKIT
jgi:hypothetical protein